MVIFHFILLYFLKPELSIIKVELSCAGTNKFNNEFAHRIIRSDMVC